MVEKPDLTDPDVREIAGWVVEPFGPADAEDWRYLFDLLGHGGHGKFWRSRFAEFIERLKQIHAAKVRDIN
jgi:hypothetical protein